MIPNVTRGGKTHGVLLYLVGKGKREEHENPHVVAGSPEAVRMAESSEPLERSDADRAGAVPRRAARGVRHPGHDRRTRQEHGASHRQPGCARVALLALSAPPGARARGGAVGGDRRGLRRADGVRRRGDRQGAVPVGRDPPRPLRRRLRPRPPGRHARGRGRQQGLSAQRPAARPEGMPGARAALRAPTPRSPNPRGRKPGAQARRAGRRPPAGPSSSASEASTPNGRARQTLERIVRACATASRNESEFIQRLRDEGIKCRVRFREGGTDVVVGYSVRLSGPADGPRKTVWYGGGRLARDLTLPALRLGWGQTEEAQQGAVDEWK